MLPKISPSTFYSSFITQHSSFPAALKGISHYAKIFLPEKNRHLLLAPAPRRFFGLGAVRKTLRTEESQLGEAKTTKWKFGMIVTASGGPCKNLVGYAAIPTDWPEQQVSVCEEDISHTVKVSYKTVDKTIKLMWITIASLPSGEEAKAVVTVKVRRAPRSRPKKPASTRCPTRKSCRPTCAAISTRVRASNRAIPKIRARPRNSSRKKTALGRKSRPSSISSAARSNSRKGTSKPPPRR